ncbi:MAG: protoporphyrinogen oxidase [Bacteroidota bacterium]
MKRVLVAGGGISGLAAAWWLREAGLRVTVLERDPAPGGTMKTVREGGWLVETGPNSALETTPLIGRLCAGAGVSGRRIYPDARAERRYILRGGRLHPLPMSPGAFLRSGLWSVRGKLRLLKEPFVGRAVEEESVAAFVERRLGREFLEYAIDPFVAGVYAGNPRDLSVRSAFPKLYALEARYGGLIMGAVRGRKERRRRREKAKDRARLFSFEGGMQVLPDALAAGLGGDFQGGTEVRGLARRDAGWEVSWVRDGTVQSEGADAVVLAVPAFAAAALLGVLDPAMGASLEVVAYPPVAQVFLGFPEDRIGVPLDGFGFLVPAKEGRRILGTLWSSALFPGRSPAGFAALTTFVGGGRQPALAGMGDGELIDLVVTELGSIMGVRGEPAFARVIRWERAIPQYAVGYHRLLASCDAFEASHRGVFLTGNYRGGIAVGDCIASGMKTAARVLDALEIPHPYGEDPEPISVEKDT